MKRIVKYILVLIVVALVGYKSIYFKKLSEVNNTKGVKFDAAAYSQRLWNEKLPSRLDSAIELGSLIKLIESNPTNAFAQYSNAMGIGNYRYSLVKLTGVASIINEDDIILQIHHADSIMRLKLATEYIYGNAIRDASGLLDIRDFANTSDLNSISEELNKSVRSSVLPPFKREVKQGDSVEVKGAIQFNKEHISFSNLELIPVTIKIVR